MEIFYAPHRRELFFRSFISFFRRVFLHPRGYFEIPTWGVVISYIGIEKFLRNFLVADYLAEKYEVTVWRDVDR